MTCFTRKKHIRILDAVNRRIAWCVIFPVWAMFCLPAAVSALEFRLDAVTISAYDQWPGGLKIETAPVNTGPMAFSLEQGQSVDLEIFDIWVAEGETRLDGDDEIPQAITAALDIFVLDETASLSVDGQTWAKAYIDRIFTDDAGRIFIDMDGIAHVDWENPVELVFGPEGDGLLRMTLSPARFGHDPLPQHLTPGLEEAARIIATMELVQAPVLSGQDPPGSETAPTPEPATVLLFGAGLIGLAAWRRRFGR